MSKINQTETAKNLKQFRLDNGWTQQQFAELIQANRTYVSDMETCNKKITQCYIDRIVKEFGAKAEDIAVYTDTYEEGLYKGYYEGTKKAIAYYEKLYGLLPDTNIPFTYIGEVMDEYPNCGMAELIRLISQIQGYKIAKYESKINNNIATMSNAVKTIEWDLSKFPSSFTNIFCGHYVYGISDDRGIEWPISSETIREIENFIHSGVKGFFEAKRNEFILFTDEANLSEEERDQMIKRVNKTCSSAKEIIDRVQKAADYKQKEADELKATLEFLKEKVQKLKAEND